MEKSDLELITEYQRGATDAFTDLVERYSKPVFLFAYRMSKDRDMATDIAQETFVKVWKKLPTFKPGAQFKTWIFTIARNTVIDYLRKKRSTPFSIFDTEDGKNMIEETVQDEAPLPPELIERAEKNALLEKNLAKLDPIDQEILELHYREDLTFDEIGTILRRPLDTVKSRHYRAIKKLQTYFSEDPET